MDENMYETGIKITDDELEKINIVRDNFCGNCAKVMGISAAYLHRYHYFTLQHQN